MAEGIDSYAPRSGAAMRAFGKAFVLRYLGGAGARGVTRAEIADLRSHGIDVGLIFENGRLRARGGHAAGVADGQTAAGWLSTLGAPAGTAVYFTVDFDAQLSDRPAIAAYLRGAAAGVGKPAVGVYGSDRVVTWCVADNSATWFWQTYAWSYGAVSSHAHLLQYRNGLNLGGHNADLDRSFRPDWGQWRAPSVSHPPAIIPPGIVLTAPTPKEKNVMIPQGGLTVTSSHVMQLAKGQPLFRWPGGPKVTAMSKAGSVPYMGNAGAGWRAVQVGTGAPYVDHLVRPTILYVPSAAGPVEPRP